MRKRNVLIGFAALSLCGTLLSSCGEAPVESEPSAPSSISSSSSAYSEYVNDQGLAFYLLDDNTYSVSAGTATQLSHIDVPERYNGRTITAIAERGFNSCANLKSISLPTTITSIGNAAFASCSSLTTIDIPDKITEIPASLFYACAGLTSINIPSGVKTIGNEAFRGCQKLGAITFPEGLTSIGSHAFDGCFKLTFPTFPKSLRSIGISAFAFCSSIKAISIYDTIQNIGTDAFTGRSYGLTYVYVEKVTVHVSSFSNYLSISGLTNLCLSSAKDLSLLDGAGNEITEVTVPSGITAIPDFAFCGADKIQSITLPEGLISIGTCAFEVCNSLTSLHIPASVTTIDDSAGFCQVTGKLSTITVAEGNSNFAVVNGVLYNKNMTRLVHCPTLKSGSVDIPAGVTNIAYGAFERCINLASVSVPSTVAVLGRGAFFLCSALTTLTIPNAEAIVTSDSYKIQDYMFCNCYSLTSLSVPDYVSQIGYGAFAVCQKIPSLSLPNVSYRYISSEAFAYCSSLEWVILKDCNTDSLDKVFSKCSSLSRIYTKETTPSTTHLGEKTIDVCAYSETEKHSEDGFYWHYVDGVPTLWETIA